jgi:signal transduction histidine kinase
MFNSLRSRLIISYIVVVVLTLFISGAALVLFLQGFESTRLTQRLVAALVPADFTARTMLTARSAPDDVVTQIHDQLEDPSWRVILYNDQRSILADSSHQLVGHTWPATPGAVVTLPRRLLSGRTDLNGRTFLFVELPVGGVGGRTDSLVLSAIPRPFVGALEDLAGPLASAGAIALVVAVLIGLLLAGSISEPLGRLTKASEEIARGNYGELIEVEGQDEVSRLGTSFNAMAGAVKHSQQTQKDFVANVSHELKTPLTSIQGFSQAIVEGAVHDMEGAQRAAKLIYDEAQRMSRLVGDLLMLARLDTHQTTSDEQTLDLASMLPTWVSRFQSRAAEVGLSLNLSLDSPPPVAGNAGRLEQVVSNLIDNAIKYNHKGGSVEVRAGLETRPDPAARSARRKRGDGRKPEPAVDWAIISVSDTGMGIPRNSLSRLFERFYRADKARVAGGTGLGLAIAREIVEAHGGHIDVKTDEGKGTTFTVWLPAKGPDYKQ